MKGEKFCRKGSFTVELSLLMPLLIFVVLLLLFWLIYMYDLSIIQEAVIRGTKQAFYYTNEPNEVIERECSKVILGDMEDGLVCVRDMEVTMEVSAMSVRANVTGYLNVPQIIDIQDDSEGIWKLNVEWEEARMHPPSLVVTSSQMKKLYSKLVQNEATQDAE